MSASEFRRAPSSHPTHRTKRDEGVLFCFVFCHETENEEFLYKKHLKSVGPIRGNYQSGPVQIKPKPYAAAIMAFSCYCLFLTGLVLGRE